MVQSRAGEGRRHVESLRAPVRGAELSTARVPGRARTRRVREPARDDRAEAEDSRLVHQVFKAEFESNAECTRSIAKLSEGNQVSAGKTAGQPGVVDQLSTFTEQRGERGHALDVEIPAYRGAAGILSPAQDGHFSAHRGARAQRRLPVR